MIILYRERVLGDNGEKPVASMYQVQPRLRLLKSDSLEVWQIR